MFEIDFSKLWKCMDYNPDDPLLLNSVFFFFFFTVFLFVFLLIHKRIQTRVIVLSVFSLYFFYKACGWYIGFILLAAIIDFGISNAIFKTKEKSTRKILLILSIIINIGVLIFFKYTNFFIDSTNELLGGKIHPLTLILPVGISFYTFENISYIVDVYRGNFRPVKSFFDYLFFLSFFPKLMMGPIVRASDFIPQIRKDVFISSEDVGSGLFLILSGLFKKVVISDFIWLNFGQYIFENPGRHSGAECLFGVYCYALVIYCDFSGYSDMAIGIARWIGIKIPDNFNAPYKASNLTDFWRRWHISLSSWLRDYIYISIGGNRGAKAGTWIISSIFFGVALIAAFYAGFVHMNWWPVSGLIFFFGLMMLPKLIFKGDKNSLSTGLNQMNTMLLGGLWHGASWNFLFWGFLHGIGLSFDKIRKRFLPDGKYRWIKIVGMFLTFHFICFTWIFFAAAAPQKGIILNEADKWNKAIEILNRIFFQFNWETLIPMIKGYGPVFGLMLLGFCLHLLPQRIERNTMVFIGKMPLYGKLMVIIVVVWVVVQAHQSEQMLPIYLQY